MRGGCLVRTHNFPFLKLIPGDVYHSLRAHREMEGINIVDAPDREKVVNILRE